MLVNFQNDFLENVYSIVKINLSGKCIDFLMLCILMRLKHENEMGKIRLMRDGKFRSIYWFLEIEF
jgi:hypothetical protein